MEQLLQMPDIPQRAARITSHMLQAERIWTDRILSRTEKTPGPWDELSSESWLAMAEHNLEDIRRIAETESRLSMEADYTNTKGQTFRNFVRDILQHLLLHGAYHRGQLALLLRQNGENPPATDYIFYLRE
ncbi:DinB family protein [Roseivirga sp. BDSF3-8]|uniref:DinB family protein n=1 Tax=Roseivirga sp. BDSF3-8 TaxID=3241598 RepID=UPI0035319D90